MTNVPDFVSITCSSRPKFMSSPNVECVWNVMAHGDARKGKWRGDWRMEWVASTLTLPRNVVYPALLTLMRAPRLPAVDWTDAPADLNGLIRFSERRNLVSARVPSRFKRTVLNFSHVVHCHLYTVQTFERSVFLVLIFPFLLSTCGPFIACLSKDFFRTEASIRRDVPWQLSCSGTR